MLCLGVLVLVEVVGTLDQGGNFGCLIRRTLRVL